MEVKIHTDAGELARPVVKLQGKAASTHTAENPLVYKWGKEYRDLSELQKIAEQLPGKPVTLNHPTKLAMHGGELDKIGVVTAARLDGEVIVVDFELDGLDRIGDVLRDGRQLSLGYEAATDENDFQRLATVDHLAMCDLARGGMQLETRLDSKVHAHFDAMDGVITQVACQTPEVLYNNNSVEESNMKELEEKIATLEKEVAESKTRLDAAEALKTELRTKLDAAEAAKDAALLASREATKNLEASEASKVAEIKIHVDAKEKAEADLASEKVRMDSAAKEHLDSQIKERVELLSQVNAILPEPAADAPSRVSMTPNELKCAVVMHVDAEDVSTQPQSWIDGCYAGALKRHAKSVKQDAKALDSTDAALKELAKVRQDNADAAAKDAQDIRTRERAAKEKMQNHSAAGWQRKNK